MRKSWFTIATVTFINSFNFAVLIPVFPFVVQNYQLPSWVYGWLISSYAIAAAVATPILGRYSDRHGRKPILLFSQIGSISSWILFTIPALVIFKSPELYIFGMSIFFIARIVDGSTAGAVGAAHALLADMVVPHKRTKLFSLLGALVGVAYMIGPVIGGALYTYAGIAGVGVFQVIINTVVLGLIIVLAPEKKIGMHQEQSLLHTNSLAVILNFKLQFIITIKIIFMLCLAGIIVLNPLFLMNTFKLNSIEIGMIGFFLGAFSIINGTFTIQRLSTIFKDQQLLTIGFVCMGTSTLMMPTANSIYALLLFLVINNLGVSISFPTLKSLLSQKVDQAHQGSVMGLDESLNAVSFAVGPFIFGYLYFYVQQSSYWVIALGMAVALGIIVSNQKLTIRNP